MRDRQRAKRRSSGWGGTARNLKPSILAVVAPIHLEQIRLPAVDQEPAGRVDLSNREETPMLPWN